MSVSRMNMPLLIDALLETLLIFSSSKVSEDNVVCASNTMSVSRLHICKIMPLLTDALSDDIGSLAFGRL